MVRGNEELAKLHHKFASILQSFTRAVPPRCSFFSVLSCNSLASRPQASISATSQTPPEGSELPEGMSGMLAPACSHQGEQEGSGKEGVSGSGSVETVDYNEPGCSRQDEQEGSGKEGVSGSSSVETVEYGEQGEEKEESKEDFLHEHIPVNHPAKVSVSHVRVLSGPCSMGVTTMRHWRQLLPRCFTNCTISKLLASRSYSNITGRKCYLPPP